MQSPTDQIIMQGSHGTSKAVDHRAWPDDIVYAPEDATFDSYQKRGSGTNDAGNALRIRGASGLHQFAHLSESFVKAGDKIVRGQPIARMGYTGYVQPAGAAGKHLHYWIQKPDGSYVYPPTLYKDTFSKVPVTQGDDSMSLATESVKTLYRRLFGREGDTGGIKNYTGKTLDFALQDMIGSQEFKSLHTKVITEPVEKIVYQDNPETQKLVNDLREETKVWSEKFYDLEEDATGLSELNDELKQAIEIKDKEIKRLEANQVEGSPWERIIGAIKELFRKG